MAKRSAWRHGSNAATSWEPVADWYIGWVGRDGSKYHRQLAVPALLELLAPEPEEAILDIGAGPGVLAPPIAAAGAHYTGIDASEKMIRFARRFHGHLGRFLLADACQLAEVPELRPATFDAVVFLLSIQDMQPLQAVLDSASWALKPGGRAILLMTHPCFRVPRLSGWGWDEGRKMHYRRVDRYLSPLPVPMKAYRQSKQQGTTWSFHRPLQAYINGLSTCGLLLDRMAEIAATQLEQSGTPAEAGHRARQEIPLFLGLRACKVAR